MYYRVRINDSLSHSKGSWRVHKYLRKLGKKYFYYNKGMSNEKEGVRTYTHIRSDDERSGAYKPNVREVDVLQEVNSEDWFSSWSKYSTAALRTNSRGELTAYYYRQYRVGKIERFARDYEQKAKDFIARFSKGRIK